MVPRVRETSNARLLMPMLLCQSAVAIGGRARVDQVDVRHLVQVSSQCGHGLVQLAQVERFLGLGVGFVRDADLQVECRPCQFGQGNTADKPGVVGDVLHGESYHRQLLAKHGLGQGGDQVDAAAGERGIGLSREVNDDVWHESLHGS